MSVVPVVTKLTVHDSIDLYLLAV